MKEVFRYRATYTYTIEILYTVSTYSRIIIVNDFSVHVRVIFIVASYIFATYKLVVRNMCQMLSVYTCKSTYTIIIFIVSS